MRHNGIFFSARLFILLFIAYLIEWTDNKSTIVPRYTYKSLCGCAYMHTYKMELAITKSVEKVRISQMIQD